MWDGCGGSRPHRGQEMVGNCVSHRCVLRRLHQERSRGQQRVPREPSDIARIAMLGAKREVLIEEYWLLTPRRIRERRNKRDEERWFCSARVPPGRDGAP